MPARDLHAHAFGLAVEIGDWNRFTGRTIGAYLGLVPSENSSGHPVPRRHHQDREHPRPTAFDRGRLAPPTTLQHAVRADALPLGGSHLRSPDPRPCRATDACTNGGSLFGTPERPVIANVAIARELAGWCWSLASEAQKAANPQGH